MTLLRRFVRVLLVLTFAAAAVGEDNNSVRTRGVSSLSSGATEVNSVLSSLDLQTPRPLF